MGNINLLQLFSVPVYKTTLNSLTDDIKTSLKNIQVESMQDENGYYSVDKFILNCLEYKPLFEEVDYHLKYYVYNILKIKKTIDFYMTSSWMVKHLTDNFANPHIHSNSLFSGVIYLNEDPNFGKIVFENRYNNLFYKTLDIEFEEFNEINSDLYWLHPKENMLILFPSNLYHTVTRNESKETRYSLAFNYFVKGTLGFSTSVLDLK